jgi:hypothetical protein
MRCIGRTKNLSRCKKETPFLFCNLHTSQWVGLLFISIPTILVLYISLFHDILIPLFENNKSQEIVNKEANVVLSLYSQLENGNYISSFLFTNQYLKHCRDTKMLEKSGDFFMLLESGKISELIKPLEGGKYDFVLGARKLVVKKRFEGKMYGSDSSVNLVLLEDPSSIECEINFSSYAYIESDSIFNFLDTFSNNIYLPKQIKKDLNYLKEISFSPIPVTEISNASNAFFFLGTGELSDTLVANSKPPINSGLYNNNIIYKMNHADGKQCHYDDLLWIFDVTYKDISEWLQSNNYQL